MSAAMIAALFFTVALLVTTAYFLMGSVPLLILKHDRPKDSRFVRAASSTPTTWPQCSRRVPRRRAMRLLEGWFLRLVRQSLRYWQPSCGGRSFHRWIRLEPRFRSAGQMPFEAFAAPTCWPYWSTWLSLCLSFGASRPFRCNEAACGIRPTLGGSFEREAFVQQVISEGGCPLPARWHLSSYAGADVFRT